MRDYRNGYSHQGRHFAAAAVYGNGRVVVTADSGFIGSTTNTQPDRITSSATTRPGFGLLEAGNNRPFILNTLHWLGGTE